MKSKNKKSDFKKVNKLMLKITNSVAFPSTKYINTA